MKYQVLIKPAKKKKKQQVNNFQNDLWQCDLFKEIITTELGLRCMQRLNHKGVRSCVVSKNSKHVID